MASSPAAITTSRRGGIEPTGDITYVHVYLGTAVLIVSTELDEVSGLADRILVMYRGKVVGIVPSTTPRDVLGLMMAGVAPEAEGEAA
jgi:ABC-type sulfate/molybdate transport systems ATPase subunit